MSDRLVVHGRTAPLALASTGAGDTSAGRRSAPAAADTDRQMEALRIELERLLDEARHG